MYRHGFKALAVVAAASGIATGKLKRYLDSESESQAGFGTHGIYGPHIDTQAHPTMPPTSKPKSPPDLAPPTVTRRRKDPTKTYPSGYMAYRRRRYRRKSRKRSYRRRRWRSRANNGIAYKAILPKVSRAKHRLDYNAHVGFLHTTTGFINDKYVGAPTAQYDFKINSMHDPYGSNHTPTLFDTMRALYTNYVVRRVYIVVDCFDTRPVMVQNLLSDTGALIQPAGSSVPDTTWRDQSAHAAIVGSCSTPLIIGMHPVINGDTTYDDFPYRHGCKTQYLKPGGSCRFVYKLDPNRFAGERSSLSNASVVCASESDPTKIVRMRVAAARMDPNWSNKTLGAELMMNIRMWFDVAWGTPKHDGPDD